MINFAKDTLALIFMNNKKEIFCITALKDFLRLLKTNENKNLKLLSYTTDYELALINACDKVFRNTIKVVGCLFHFGQAL